MLWRDRVAVDIHGGASFRRATCDVRDVPGAEEPRMTKSTNDHHHHHHHNSHCLAERVQYSCMQNKTSVFMSKEDANLPLRVSRQDRQPSGGESTQSKTLLVKH